MSIPSNYPRNLDPVIPIDQGIYETSTTQKAPLGTRLTVGNRVFRYAKAGGAVKPGQIVIGVIPVASNTVGICTIKTQATTGANVVSVSVGTAVTLNQYAEGYLQGADTTSAGGGMTFRIKSHPVVATNTSGNFTLYDSLPCAMDSAQGCNLIPNPYNGVTVGSAAANIPVGVVSVSGTSGDYMWLQTWGPGGIVASAANTTVWGIQAGSGGFGAQYIAQSASGPSLPIVGIGTIVATGSMTQPVHITIAP